MNRRDTGIALFALWAVSHRGWAQPASKVFRIGVLSQYFPRERFTLAAALREFGYEEGRNFVFDFRYADGRDDRLASLAAGLVESKVDLIVAVTNAETLAAKRATSAIPIIMWNAVAPVEVGLVASLARPGANVTGTTVQVPEHAGKLLEVLRDAVPRAARVAVLWDPNFPGIEVYRHEAERAAKLMGIRLTLLPGRSLLEIDTAFDVISRDHPDALYVVNTGAIFTHRGRVIEMAAYQRVPAMYVTKLLATEGGLMSYSPDAGALMHRTAAIIDRVLKGANPAEIPVEQPTKYELVLNLKAAKALGFTFPVSLLLRADEVIR